MENMEIYNKVRTVPEEAKKKIGAGRLSGFTDINPMWRIKKLTEVYGPCGIGWYTKTVKKWLEPGANGEVKAFVDIELYVKDRDSGQWSMPIEGNGGSSFISKEKSGLFTSDECYKMAYTDAIGSAAKLLGMAADVYYEKDRTKYTTLTNSEPPETAVQNYNIQADEATNETSEVKEYKCCACGKPFEEFTDKSGKKWSAGQAYHLAESFNMDGKPRCSACMNKYGMRKRKNG